LPYFILHAIRKNLRDFQGIGKNHNDSERFLSRRRFPTWLNVNDYRSAATFNRKSVKGLELSFRRRLKRA